jgi:hypothetical protein
MTPPGKWLLLLLQLPTRPASARIKTWRRLQQLGSVAIKNSVYALPNTPQAREDFEWLRAEIAAAKGQASIMTADALTAAADEEIRDAFLRQRTGEYDALRAGVDRVWRGLKSRPTGAARLAAERTLRGGRDELARLDALEPIPVDARTRAVRAIDQLESRLTPEPERTPTVPTTVTTRTETFQGRTWVTRPRPGVDRMSSAWLIQRFIDPKARFAFADEPPAGTRKQVPFDMFGVAFGHQGERCTFEVLCDRFAIEDEGVRHLAQIVHDVDLKDGRYGLAEAAIVARMIEGLRATYADDAELLAHGVAMFAALYESLPKPAPRAGRAVRRRRKRE